MKHITRRRYRNPPIVEAICGINCQFDWDPTIPGALHAVIRDDYNGKPRQQLVMKANVQVGAQPAPAFSVQETMGRVQLPNKDETRLVSVGPEGLSIHALRPYHGWEEFRPRIVRAWEAFCSTVDLQSISGIGLRYINRIEFQSPRVDLEHYFRAWPVTPDGFPPTMTAFFHRSENVWEIGGTTENNFKLVHTFASVDATKGTLAIVLDLDLTTLGGPIATDKLLETVDGAKAKLGTAFEALITDKFREYING
ncbi:MAG: TIGR04255 family protein [Candidatus Xenobia bacterium]